MDSILSLLFHHVTEICRFVRSNKACDACDAWQTFTEAEIRASVVFQLSELVSSLLKAARATAGSPEWDAMVAGPLAAYTLGRRQNVD